MTQFTISCAVEQLGLVTSDDIMTLLLKKFINIDHNSLSQTESVWSVNKLSTESVGSRRELVTNCVRTADAEATELDSCVASAVCVEQKRTPRCCVSGFITNGIDYLHVWKYH